LSYSREIAPEYLKTQFKRGRIILFTGAGFTSTSKNLDGESVPVGAELAKKIWPLCFPALPFDPTATLQDIYQAALGKDAKKLRELLVRKLTVDPRSIPDIIGRYFSFPWKKIYTLNIDNLGEAVSQRFPLARSIVQISATDLSVHSPYPKGAPYIPLPLCHLNGTITDIPHNVTFTTPQYARRQAFPADHLYLELVADIITHPVVFIGTRLDEPPLWQHVEIRRARGSRDMREMRPPFILGHSKT
jgi:hypothetical protein